MCVLEREKLLDTSCQFDPSEPWIQKQWIFKINQAQKKLLAMKMRGTVFFLSGIVIVIFPLLNGAYCQNVKQPMIFMPTVAVAVFENWFPRKKK